MCCSKLASPVVLILACFYAEPTPLNTLVSHPEECLGSDLSEEAGPVCWVGPGAMRMSRRSRSARTRSAPRSPCLPGRAARCCGSSSRRSSTWTQTRSSARSATPAAWMRCLHTKVSLPVSGSGSSSFRQGPAEATVLTRAASGDSCRNVCFWLALSSGLRSCLHGPSCS